MSSSCCMFFLGLLPMWAKKGKWMDDLSFFSFSRMDSCPSLILFFFFSLAERRRLKKTDVPLLHRLLQGPSKENARIFLMDKDTEEISSEVWMLSPWICLCFLLTQHLSQNRLPFLFHVVVVFPPFPGGSVHSLSFFSPGIHPSKTKWRREESDPKNNNQVSQERVCRCLLL